MRDGWYDIFVPHVHAPTDYKTDYTKYSFCEELECVFDQFPKYRLNMFLGDINAKVGREYIFKSTIGRWRPYTKLIMIMELE
jgi:hypothetical protein